MKSPLIAAPFAALLALAACDNQPRTIEAGGVADPQAKELAKAAPVELPPAISSTRTYRCRDNSLVYATFYTNNTVRVSPEQGLGGTTLTAPAAGAAYVADGYSVSADAEEIQYTAPGKGTQGCTA